MCKLGARRRQPLSEQTIKGHVCEGCKGQRQANLGPGKPCVRRRPFFPYSVPAVLLCPLAKEAGIAIKQPNPRESIRLHLPLLFGYLRNVKPNSYK